MQRTLQILRTRRSEQPQRVPAPLKSRNLAVAAFIVLCLGCGTEATGVESCRRIEAARCSAAVVCGLLADSNACVRFANGNCLHGFAAGVEDNTTEVAACVQTLERASECAESEGVDASPADCGQSRWSEDTEGTVCEWVQRPETAPNCTFLTATDDDDDSDDDSEEEQQQPAANASEDADAGTR